MKKLFRLIASVLITLSANAQEYQLISPDGKLTAKIETGQNISVNLEKDGRNVVMLENLFLKAGNVVRKDTSLKVQRVTRRSVNEVIEPEIREKASSLINKFNELEIRFRAYFGITFRIYDEGLAYRFSTFSGDSLIIYGESINVRFEDDDSARFQSSKTFNSAYETPYEHDAISSIRQGKLCNLPFLAEKANGTFVMITEADLYEYPGLWLKGTGESMLTSVHPPFPKTFTQTGSAYGLGQVKETYDYIARVKGTRTYPWRIFAIEDDEKGLVSNNMVYLLASPCAIEDVSWIKPGIVMFDWWGKHNIYGVDFKAGVNTETAKYFIDFCAAHGFRYFLFDDGWSPRDNILETVPELDMEEVVRHGRSKGVDVMLWVIWNTLGRQWEEAFELFGKWGIKGIKVDFMNRDDQLMVMYYEALARKAAEMKMVVDFHGAYKPCGLRRKYPNVLTREGLIEFEYNGWTDSDNPVHHNLLPYIRMFTGPMDYIPGTMRNSTKSNFRPVGDYPMGQGTRAHSIALAVILNSPMTMLPDSPSDYYREKECTDFIAKIPVEWDESLLVEGKIAKYTILARRSGDEWFVGAITDRDERIINLETGFLGPGRYRIEAIEDGINSNTRAEDYRKTETYFQSGDDLKLKLASGGGWVARITPEK
ncbi:MAG: glycoside hydrolase family 97 protein [Bacteroidales bacterium]|nr:glycoside hydrolase family 97 protein [Bacteroidales bacterium]